MAQEYLLQKWLDGKAVGKRDNQRTICVTHQRSPSTKKTRKVAYFSPMA